MTLPSIDATGQTDVTDALCEWVNSLTPGTYDLPEGARYRCEGGFHLVGREGVVLRGNGAIIAADTLGYEVVPNEWNPDNVEFARGLPIVIRGWPEWWTLPTVPAAAELPLLVIAEVQPSDLNEGAPLKVELIRADGEQFTVMDDVYRPTRDPDAYVHGAPLFDYAPLRLQITFEDVGRIEIVISSNEGQPVSVPLGIRVSPDAQ